MDFDILKEAEKIVKNKKPAKGNPEDCQAAIATKGVTIRYGCIENHPECDTDVDLSEGQWMNWIENQAAQMIADNEAMKFVLDQETTRRIRELEKENKELREENEAYRKTVADLMKPAIDSAWRSFVKRFRVNE